MKSIEFRNVDKNYDKVEVIKNLNLKIKEGQRVILLGPSGCGKSTILRMISGLEDITKGELYLGGILSNDVDSGDRNIAMVFQNYALFPHMTVFDNIAYGLQVKRTSKELIKKRVDEVIQVLNMQGLADRKPREISGGQRQRVALARALVKQSDFFLLDEPLSNLDAQLRSHARKELVKLHEIYHQTFVYVTHDQIEAMTIGQQIVLLKDGDIQMMDTPHNVYHKPANIFTATFIGSPAMNIIDVNVEGRELYIEGAKISLCEPWLKQIEKSGVKHLKMGVRPEDVILAPEKVELSENVAVAIRYVEDYGNRVGFYIGIDGGTTMRNEAEDTEIVSIMGENPFADGWQVYWNIKQEKLHFFDAETQMNIGYPAEMER